MENLVTLRFLRVALEAGLGSGHEALVSSEERAVMVASPTEEMGSAHLGFSRKLNRRQRFHY